LLGAVVDTETQLAVEHVPKHRTGVAMIAPCPGTGIQLDHHNIEAVERSRQRMPGKLTRRRRCSGRRS
jgi:hypothetical protein